jgi:sulfate adenylyltransferase subunit 1
LLRIQHAVVAVNKMDLLDYDEDTYDAIVTAFQDFASRLDNLVAITFIPISALRGDNVVDKSTQMPWYAGPSLLQHLETVYVGSEENHVDARLPVQWVIRPQSDAHHDFRGYAGRIAGGVFKPGDEVLVLPSGFATRVTAIETFDSDFEEAFSPLSVTMTLDDDIDVSRGDMIVKPNNPPRIGQDIEAMICWFSERPLRARAKYVLRHTTKEVRAVVREMRYKVDINTLHKVEGEPEFRLNEIGRIALRTSAPLFYDRYNRNRTTGSFVLIDEQTNETVAAGMIV